MSKQFTSWRDRIRQHLDAKGITLLDAATRYSAWAKKLGVMRLTRDGVASRHSLTQGGLSHWVPGRREPRVSEILLLCKAINLPPHILFADEANVPNDVKTEESLIATFNRAVEKVASAKARNKQPA